MFRILFLKHHRFKYLLLYILKKGKPPGKENVCCTEKIHSYGSYIKPHGRERVRVRAPLYVELSYKHYSKMLSIIYFAHLEPNTLIHLQKLAEMHRSKWLWIHLQQQWIWPLHTQFYFSSKLKIPLYFKTTLYLSLHPLGPTHSKAANRLEGL